MCFNLNKKITEHEALTVFFLSSLSYLIVYFFQWGKFYYYSIPISFIEINSNSLLSSLVILSVISILVLFYLELLKEIILVPLKSRLTPNIIHELKKKIRVYSFLYIIIVAFLFEYFDLFIVVLISFLLLTVYFYLAEKKQIAFVTLIIFILSLFFTIGFLFEKFQTNKLVIKDLSSNTNYVVLHLDNSKALISKIDLKTKAFSSQFQLIKIDSDKLNKFTLELKKINGLTIKESHN